MESFENCRLCLARSRFHRSFVGLWEKHCKWQRSLYSWSGAGKLDGQVIRATFSLKLSRDKLKSVVARITTFAPILSRSKFAAHSENPACVVIGQRCVLCQYHKARRTASRNFTVSGHQWNLWLPEVLFPHFGLIDFNNCLGDQPKSWVFNLFNVYNQLGHVYFRPKFARGHART